MLARAAAAILLAHLCAGCGGYGKTCRGRWVQGADGETVCAEGRRYHRSRTVSLDATRTSAERERPGPPRTGPRWNWEPRCGVLGALGDVNRSDGVRRNECYCDCRRDGGSTATCKRACGLYSR